jgi:hypothetical protein
VRADIKKRWTDALRSGEYEQGKGGLRENTYCCLGVLCEIAREDGIGDWDERSEATGYAFSCTEDSDGAHLPEEVWRWAGISFIPEDEVVNGGDPVLEISESGSTLSCVSANDTYGLSFEEIADLIENGGVQ